MRTLAASGDFLVQPNPWLIAMAAVCLLGGLVTAAKGRYGWLALGLLFGGVLWPITAVLLAAPSSLWGRLRRPRRVAVPD